MDFQSLEQNARRAHEQFIQKYKKPEPKPIILTGKYLLLVDALRRAAEIAKPFGDTEDGGTCNFDSLELNLPGYREAETLKAAEEAGLRAWSTKIFKTQVYVVNVPVARQGNARTRQAESMKKTMRELGYDASVYYQEAMRDFLFSIRPGCRKEFQGLAVSRDYNCWDLRRWKESVIIMEIGGREYEAEV